MAHRIITRDPSIPPEAPLQNILNSVPVEPKPSLTADKKSGVEPGDRASILEPERKQ